MERVSGAAPPPQSEADGGEPTGLRVRVEDSAGGASIVTLAGELDLSTVERMQAPLLEQVQQRSAILLDLTELEFIDSSGLGALIQAKRIANGAPMATLIGVGSQVERIFEIAGVGEALSVFSDRGRALASLGAGGPAS